MQEPIESNEELQKRLKNATKKLRQIANLKEKKLKGESLNRPELEKLVTEPSLLDEVAKLEKMLLNTTC